MTRPVVFVSRKHLFTGSRGGDFGYVRAHARAAIRSGYEPHIVSVGTENRSFESEFGIMHDVRAPFESQCLLLPFHASPLIRAVEEVSRRVAGDRPMILHGFGLWSYVTSVAARNAARHGRELVPVASMYTTRRDETLQKIRGLNTCHGLRDRAFLRLDHLVTRLLLDRYERTALLGSRVVLVNYESVRRLLHRTYGVGERVRMVPYTSDSAFLDGDGCAREETPSAQGERRADGSPLIVSTSRHDARKGVDVLLGALARLRGVVPFRACLVSGGPLLEGHRRLAARLGLGEETRITGWVDDVKPWLNRADLFVLPSLQEASGSLSLIEALQARVAVVASAVDGIPEDVQDGESALLVPPGSSEALAEALSRMILDGALRDRLAANGRQVFETRFSAQTMTEALGSLYDELSSVGSRERKSTAVRSTIRACVRRAGRAR